MRTMSWFFIGLVLAAALVSGPATAVDKAPLYSPKPQWQGLPVVKIGCTSDCVSKQKACISKCLPSLGASCRVACNTAKMQCEKGCRG